MVAYITCIGMCRYGYYYLTYILFMEDALYIGISINLAGTSQKWLTYSEEHCVAACTSAITFEHTESPVYTY